MACQTCYVTDQPPAGLPKPRVVDLSEGEELPPELLALLQRARSGPSAEAKVEPAEEERVAERPDLAALLGFPEEGKKREWRQLPRMVRLALGLVWRAARWRGAVVALLQAIASAGVAAQLLAGNDLFAQALAARGSDEGLASVVPSALVVGGLSCVIAILNAYATTQSRYLSELVGARAYDQIISSAASVDLIAFEDSGFYDRLQRANVAGQMRPWMMTSGLLGLVTSVIGTAGIGFALFTLEPVLVLLVALAAAPVFVATSRNAQHMFLLGVGNTPDERERGYLRSVLTGREPAKELRAFNLVEYLRERHDRLTEVLLQRNRAESWRQAFRTLAGQAGGGIASVGAAVTLLWLLVSGRLPIAAAMTAYLAMGQLRSRVVGIGNGAAGVYESALYLEDYAAFVALGEENARRNEARAEAAGAPLQPFRTLTAEGVSLQYPGSNRFALDNVDVEIRAGEVVALVGENGSGKTTLAKVLCGLYAPTDGRVLWDGRDLRDLDPHQVWDHVAVIFQDFIRYALPARDNIGLGRHEFIADDERIRLAADLAGATGTLDQLRDGWDTVLGRQFRSGQDLSGGQWQRVALARAFFRDAPFLILDEPTASLDARAEYSLFERLRTLAQGRSVLLITHRFANVRMADRIYVLHKGRVEEAGSHLELLANGRRYAELFTMQAGQLLGIGRDEQQ